MLRDRIRVDRRSRPLRANRGRAASVAVITTVLLGLGSSPALATFAGTPGRILLSTRSVASQPILISQTIDHSAYTTYGTTDSFGGSFSPDGTRVAFYGDDGNLSGVWVQDVDGTGLRLVVPDVGGPTLSEAQVSWLPDGQHIVFAGSGGKLFEADVLTHAVIPLDPTVTVGKPYVSPNGRFIAYLASPSGASFSEVHVMNFDGTGDHIVATAPPPGSITGLSWSPNGESLVFAEWNLPPCCTTSFAYTVNADGSSLRQLSTSYPYTAVWSPDGAHLLIDTGGAAGLVLTDLDGNNATSVEGSQNVVDWQALP